mgnify:CR=1 FL=1
MPCSESLPNVKQVLTIVLAVIIFNVVLNPTNLLGITLTLCGGACASPFPFPCMSLCRH